MTPQERELIQDLFDRMRDFGPPTKDREADQLIRQWVSELRDAPYMLVQSMLVQEHALEQASARIQELEDRLHMLHERQRPLPSRSFLGRLFGGGGATIPQGSPLQQAPSGGVLQSAMSTAAGIGGGLLVSNALRNMIGGRAQAGQDTPAHEALARQDAADDAEIDQQVQDELDDAETDAEMAQGGDEMDV